MKTVLLIDDCQQLRTSFSMALRTNGYHVIEADSGVAGLEMARKHLPDLILTTSICPEEMAQPYFETFGVIRN